MSTQQFTPEQRTAIQQESLTRAVTGVTMTNYPAIFEGFMAKGIPEHEIIPRSNIFTFNAWRALGYSVKKGEHGVKVITWVTAKGKETQDGDEAKQAGFKFAKTTTVFHVSQVSKVN